MVLAAGWLTGSLIGDTGPLPHLAAGISAAIVFGPIRSATTRWLDRRFFRDRAHYLEALRRAGESLALLREPADLAREACEQIALAVRAESVTLADSPEAPPDGIAVAIGGSGMWLVLGPRKSGDLYSTDDRHLLGAFASQLAVALANAGALLNMPRRHYVTSFAVKAARGEDSGDGAGGGDGAAHREDEGRASARTR